MILIVPFLLRNLLLAHIRYLAHVDWVIHHAVQIQAPTVGMRGIGTHPIRHRLSAEIILKQNNGSILQSVFS